MLSYVDKLKYIGHSINDKLCDDEDIDRERINLQCYEGLLWVQMR